MRSLLGRFHRPMSRGLVNNMLTMNNLGDGSTLSLDFTTMGDVLDPRLTFSRASTATFVNSSGYVEWAGANTAAYSESLITAYNDNAILSRSTTTSPTGNTAVVIYPTLVSDYHRLQFTYAVAMVGATTLSVYVKQIGSNYRVGINSTGYIGAGAIFSLVGAGSVVAVGGTAANRAATITKVTDDGWYRIALTGTYAAVTSTYLFMDSSTSTDHTGGPFTGVASQGVSFWGFQINPGSTAQTYYPTTTAAYHAPRFDYSPTNIGEPRGLLVEGVGINISTRSEDFANADWTKDSSVGSTNADVTTVSATTPANGATVNQIVFSRIVGGYSRVTRSCVGTVTTAYTMSVWLRTVSGTANVGLRIGADSAGFKCAVTTTWKRFQYTYTLVGLSTDANAQIMLWENIVGTDLTATVYAWGCQVEAGSGASSYIPTGASGVTRNADFLLSASSSGAGRGTEFSLDDLAPGTSALNEYTVLWTYGRDPNSKRDYPASLYARTNANTLRIDMRDFSGTTAWVATQTRTVQNVTVGTASKLKLALSQNTSAYPISAINGTSATFTSGIIDSAFGLQWVQLCNTSMVSGAWNPIWAQQLKVYPTALTAAQLQTLTTP